MQMYRLSNWLPAGSFAAMLLFTVAGCGGGSRSASSMAAIPAVAPQAVKRVASASGLQSRRRQAYAHQRPMSLVAGATVATGTMYVAASSGVVSEYSPAAVLLKSSIGNSNDLVIDVGVDAHANVYVFAFFANGGGGVTEYSPAGVVIRQMSMPLLNDSATVVHAIVDPAGNVLFLCNQGNVSMFVMKGSPTGAITRLFTSPTPNVAGLAVDRNGNVYLSEAFFNTVTGAEASSVVKYSPVGALLSTVARAPVGVFGALTVDASGNVYVVNDYTSNNVLKFSAGGALLGSISTDVNFAAAMTTDSAGNLFVLNMTTDAKGNASGQDWVSIYKPTGTLAQSFLAGAASTTLNAIAVAPSPPPKPSPIAAAAISQLEGDIAQAPDGSVIVYATPPPNQIAYVNPSASGTGTTAHTRGPLTVAAPPIQRTLPPRSNYLPPPKNLVEHITVLDTFASYVKSKIMGGLLPPACIVNMVEQRPSTDLTSPYNPAYYQLQAYCENGASIASFRSTWEGTSYNNDALTKAVEVLDGCDIIGTSGVFATCFSHPKLLPVAFALSERNRPLDLFYTMNVYGEKLSAEFSARTDKFDLNNRSVPYPKVLVQKDWGPSAQTSSYVPDLTASRGPYVYTSKGCADYVGKSAKLIVSLKNATPVAYPIPKRIGDSFEAHHIKPSCFGGTNDASNGMWLPGTGSPVDLHQSFSTWASPGQQSKNLSDANFDPRATP